MKDKDVLAEALFRERYITTRAELLTAIAKKVTVLQRETMGDDNKNSAYHDAKLKLLQRFAEDVKHTSLFERLELGWIYSVSIGSRGATLHLQHWQHVAIIPFENGCTDLDCGDCDAFFNLIQTEAQLLSAEEYAKRCGVSSDTIRMWIRRGKIRSAVKLGNTWKIPENAEPISRGFKDACYEWSHSILAVSEEFHFLSTPGSLSIRRIRSRELPFIVTNLDNHGELLEEKRLSVAETERLEAYLISNPRVIFTGDLEFIKK